MGDGAGGPALVVFADDNTLKCLRPLRRGFRHCFVAVRRDGCWILCNPLSHFTDLDVIGAMSPAALAEWYRGRGFVVVETEVVVPPPVLAPLRLFTCVEVVKRTLGLRAPWVFTPRQLYRHLMARQPCQPLSDAAEQPTAATNPIAGRTRQALRLYSGGGGGDPAASAAKELDSAGQRH